MRRAMLSTVQTQHLMTTAEAASHIGRDRSTITRWVAAGRIAPAVQVPGYRGDFLFAEDDVAALAAEVAE